MASEGFLETHRFCLPPGTVVEDWCVVGCHGHGAYGIVYRAVRVGHEAAGEVALKVALYPWDPRFMREVALLSLIHHPSVPRLRGQGFWKHPSGTVRWPRRSKPQPGARSQRWKYTQESRLWPCVPGLRHEASRGEPGLSWQEWECCWRLGSGWRCVCSPKRQPGRRGWLGDQRERPRGPPAWADPSPRPRWRPGRRPPSRRRSVRNFPQSRAQGRSGPMRGGSALDASRFPSTEAAGWNGPDSLRRSANRTATCSSRVGATARPWRRAASPRPRRSRPSKGRSGVCRGRRGARGDF
jgi:hypothetical protein